MNGPRVSLRTLAGRGVRLRWARLMLTVLSIAAGVGFFTGSSIVGSSLKSGFSDLFQQFNEGVDFQIRAQRSFGDELDERPYVSTDVADDIARMEGVARVEAVVFREATLLGPSGPVQPSAGPSALIAVAADPLPGVDVRSGRGPEARDEAVVDTRTARLLGLTAGKSEITVLVGNQKMTLNVVGTIAQTGAADYLGAVIVGVNPQWAGELAGTPGRADALAVVLEPQASSQGFLADVARLLEPNVEIVPSETVVNEQLSVLNRFLDPFSNALLGFAVVALFVAGFIVTNTFTIGISQRLRELAIMRAIGASTRQMYGLVIIESVLVGIVASVLGLAAGYGVARGIVGLLSSTGGFPGVDLQLTATTMVLAAGTGIGVTVLAALRPALKAARLSPMAAFSDSTGTSRNRRPVTSIAVFALGGGGIVLGTLGSLEARTSLLLSGLGAFALYAAMPGVGSLLVGPFAALLRRARSRSVTVTMAGTNSQRSPRRTAAAAAALTIGLSLVGAVTVIGDSMAETLDRTFADNVSGSHVARSSNRGPGGIPTTFAGDLRDIGAFDHVVGVTSTTVRIGEEAHRVSAVDSEGFTDTFQLDVTAGTLTELATPGAVAFDQELASRLGIAIGDRVDVTQLNQSADTWVLVGVFQDPGLLLADVITSKATAERTGNDLPSDRYVIAGGAAPDWEARTRDLAGVYPQIDLQTLSEFSAERREQIDSLLGVINALLGLTIAVAVIGIANTLSLTVLERRKELALLRAVGAEKSQIRRMIRLEALLVGGLGSALGTSLGLALGVLATRALPSALVGTLAVDARRLLLLTIVGVATALAASWWPGRRAAASDVLAGTRAE